MKTKRIKAPILKSKEAVAALVAETVECQLAREALVLQRDREVLAITERLNPEIEDIDRDIAVAMTTLQQWADANPGEFGDARSLTMAGHRLGYRLGNPAVKPKAKMTIAKVVASIAALGGAFAERFLRVKTDLDKDAVLSLHRQTTSGDAEARKAAADTLAALPVDIVQSETFYLEPNREGQANPTMTAEATK